VSVIAPNRPFSGRYDGKERPVPHDISAEEAVLGALLLDRDAIVHVAPFLKAGDFYLEKHGWIYQAIAQLYERREPPDMSTLASELERSGRLDKVGGAAYVASLMHRVPTSVHVVYYGRNVERASILRQLISAGGNIAALGYEREMDLPEVLESAQVILRQIVDRKVRNVWAESLDLLESYYRESENIAALEDGEMLGISSGLPELDAITLGFRPGELIIPAARPRVGKTAFALNVTRHACNKGKSVAFFSLEMGKAAIVNRLVASLAKVDHDLVRDRRLDDAQARRVENALTTIGGWPLAIDVTGKLRVTDLCNRALARMSVQPYDLLIVDYLQRVTGAGNNRQEEVASVSRELAALAKELDVPVLALAQLNREAEHRGEQEPQLTDLRESGGIEADADIVILMHRPGLVPGSTVGDFVTHLNVAKNRNGDSRPTKAAWSGPYQRLDPLSYRDSEEGWRS
jgi:replicative DNA helicase